MDFPCSRIERQEEPVLFQRLRTSVDQLPAVMGRVYGSIMAGLEKARGFPAGPPYAAYYNMDRQDLDVEIGIPVASPQDGFEDIRSGIIPAGPYASCMYTGPYDQIAPAYQVLAAWIETQGLEPTGAAYEFYLNDPAGTPPSELQTQILFPLKD
jgi:effector-binding domain-containing protein